MNAGWTICNAPLRNLPGRGTGWRLLGCLLLAAAAIAGCTNKQPSPVEYYQPAYRQFPPDPVYSRVMWSHLPQPIPPRTGDQAPLLLPVISFELPDSTLGEAVEALAQTMGYRWHFPSQVANRPVRIRMEGTVEEVLAEIGKQAQVQAKLDHHQRMVLVLGPGMSPQLPNAGLQGR